MIHRIWGLKWHTLQVNGHVWFHLHGLSRPVRHGKQDKKEEIWPSPMTKAHTPTEMSKRQSDNTKKPTKSSIKQQLRTDLGRSVGVTTATQLVWFTRFTGPNLSTHRNSRVIEDKNIQIVHYSNSKVANITFTILKGFSSGKTALLESEKNIIPVLSERFWKLKCPIIRQLWYRLRTVNQMTTNNIHSIGVVNLVYGPTFPLPATAV